MKNLNVKQEMLECGIFVRSQESTSVYSSPLQEGMNIQTLKLPTSFSDGICCKVAEHNNVSQTMWLNDLHNILVDGKHGFRRKLSCETQCLITTYDLAAILNRHSQADVAVLDFAKAFDEVPHHRLLKKLKYYNLDNNVVGWASSFLTGRTQRVVVDGHTSSEVAELSGVPLGTVLGPLLFLVFIYGIIQGSSSSIRLFVDDCLVYREICSKSDCSAL